MGTGYRAQLASRSASRGMTAIEAGQAVANPVDRPARGFSSRYVRGVMRTRTSRAALTALLTLPVLALVGCAAAAAEAPASTPSSAPTSPATATPKPEPVGPVWPEDRCQDEQLAAELVARPELSGAGQEGFAIVLTNVSEQSCSYYGRPGVLLLGADGTLLTSHSDKPWEEVPPGALAPGESAQVEGLLTEVGAYDCTPVTATTVRVLVTSDGAGAGIEAPVDLQVCGDVLSDLTIGALTPAP